MDSSQCFKSKCSQTMSRPRWRCLRDRLTGTSCSGSCRSFLAFQEPRSMWEIPSRFTHESKGIVDSGGERVDLCDSSMSTVHDDRFVVG